MAYAIQALMGASFALGPFPNCKLAFIDSPVGLGHQCALFTAPLGSEEYDIAGFVWMGDLPAAVTASGGSLGGFIVNTIWPAANAMVESA